MFAKIKIYRSCDHDFRFELVAPNRAILGSSGKFKNRDDVLDAIRGLQAGSLKCEYGVDSSGKHYFALCAENGETVFRSQSYSSKSAAIEAQLFAVKTAAEARLVERDR